jgi:putative thioredoxin
MIVDVGDRDFEREVVERSRDLPVVVDLWAPWCGPCRALGPVLERLATEQAGAFVLAKVNVDEAPAVAQRLRVQSIPAVKAFRDGAVVAEFVGAQPERAVRDFLASILPSEADRLAREGERKSAAGDAPGAEAAFDAALAADARHPRALLGLARIYAASGQEPKARSWSASRRRHRSRTTRSASRRSSGPASTRPATRRRFARASPRT